MRGDIDRQSHENFEQRKNQELTESRNAEMGNAARGMESRLRDREDQIYGLRKDLESSRMENQRMRSSNID